jgi:hypothetical protein
LTAQQPAFKLSTLLNKAEEIMPFDGLTDRQAIDKDELQEILTIECAEYEEAAGEIEQVARLLKQPSSWCQGSEKIVRRTLFKRHTQRCVVGAMREASVGLVARNAVRHIVNARGFPDIPGWNDEPVTTHSDVLALLKEAKQQLEAQRDRCKRDLLLLS